MQDAQKTNRHHQTGQESSEGNFGTLLALTVILCVALTMLIARGDEPARLPAGDSSSAQVQVRLHATAVVDKPQIYLADIADIEGPGSELAGRWKILSAPEAGEARVITRDQLQTILGDRGANLAKWEIRGYRECRVSRPSLAGSQDADATREAHSPDTMQPVIDNTLEGAIRAALTERAASFGGGISVRFSPAIRQLLAMRSPQYQFRIEHRGDRILGMVALDVTILEEGRVKQTVPMIVQVALRKRVVAAAQPINRNEVINAKHLSLVEQTFDQIEELGLSQTSPLIGQRAKRFIPPGELVQLKDVEPMPFVQRNDLVTVTIRRGAVSIRTVAKALGSGTYGDPVRLQNESSREAFEAVITGMRTAEVIQSVSTRPAPACPDTGGRRDDAHLSMQPSKPTTSVVENPVVAEGVTRP